MKRMLIAAALAVPFMAAGADMSCSIKANKTTPKAQYAGMAKVKDEAARKTAIDKVAVAGSTISKGALEVEEGCLVYTYDVKVPGKSGMQEVIIDAGTGAVLKVEHESAAREAAEKTGAKMKEVGQDMKQGARDTKDAVMNRKPGGDK